MIGLAFQIGCVAASCFCFGLVAAKPAKSIADIRVFFWHGLFSLVALTATIAAAAVQVSK